MNTVDQAPPDGDFVRYIDRLNARAPGLAGRVDAAPAPFAAPAGRVSDAPQPNPSPGGAIADAVARRSANAHPGANRADVASPSRRPAATARVAPPGATRRAPPWWDAVALAFGAVLIAAGVVGAFNLAFVLAGAALAWKAAERLLRRAGIVPGKRD